MTERRFGETLEDLLSPLTRLLVLGGIGVDELNHAAKRAYLRAAIETLFRPGERITVSRLAVVTGMTRKEVSALLDDSRHNHSAVRSRSGKQRALRVLRGWMTDPRFRQPNGRPAELPYQGRHRTFARLVRLYGGDVTPRSVLRELERMNALEKLKSGVLRVRSPRRTIAGQLTFYISELARVLDGAALAISQPISPDRPIGFHATEDAVLNSEQDAGAFVRNFSNRATALIDGFEQWSSGRKAKASAPTKTQRRVGIGVYLFHTDGSANSEPRLVTPSTRVPRNRSRLRAG